VTLRHQSEYNNEDTPVIAIAMPRTADYSLLKISQHPMLILFTYHEHFADRLGGDVPNDQFIAYKDTSETEYLSFVNLNKRELGTQKKTYMDMIFLTSDSRASMGKLGDATHKIRMRRFPTAIVKIATGAGEIGFISSQAPDILPLAASEATATTIDFLNEFSSKFGRKCFTGTTDLTCEAVGYA